MSEQAPTKKVTVLTIVGDVLDHGIAFLVTAFAAGSTDAEPMEVLTFYGVVLLVVRSFKNG
jgi:hypothetical protein